MNAKILSAIKQRDCLFLDLISIDGIRIIIDKSFTLQRHCIKHDHGMNKHI